MSSEQLSTRILAEQSKIKSNDIRRGKISEDQFDKFIETSKNTIKKTCDNISDGLNLGVKIELFEK